MIRPPKGFSLLEILMAFAIMAVAITVVLRIFGSGVNNAMISEDHTLAVQMAESLMASAGIVLPFAEGDTTGTEANRYFWRISMRAITPPQAPLANANPAMNPANPNVDIEAELAPQMLYLVKVNVAWRDSGNGMRHAEITSLKNPG